MTIYLLIYYCTSTYSYKKLTDIKYKEQDVYS